MIQQAAPAQFKSLPPSPSLAKVAVAAQISFSIPEVIFKITPLARKLAKQMGVSLDGLKGSGPKGRILAADVRGGVSGPERNPMHDAPQASGGLAQKMVEGAMGQDQAAQRAVPLTGLRRSIAAKMVQSKSQVPHFVIQGQIKMQRLLDLRKQLNKHFEQQDKITRSENPTKVSLNDLIVFALAQALASVPEACRTWKNDQEYLQHDQISIGIAVAIEGGLVVPVIVGVNQMRLMQLGHLSREAIDRARKRKSRPEELVGGVASVSNLSTSYGVDSFSAIINTPQSSILAIGRVHEAAIVEDGIIKIESVAGFSLSCDHRIIDGLVGAQLFDQIKRLVEDPQLMLA